MKFQSIALALAAICTAGSAEAKDFLWYCQSADATPAQKHTVAALAGDVNMTPDSSNCRSIYDKLKSQDVINLSEEGISDLSPLAEFKKIESLNVSYNKITDTKALENLPNLDRIDISNNQLTKFPNLKASRKLEMLNVGFNPISKIEHVGHLSQLKKVYIDRTYINDFSALNQSSLREISARFLQDKPDFSTFARLNKLRTLVVNESFEFDDLSPFAKFSDLRKLGCRYCGIKEATGIKNLRKMKNLYIEGNKIESISRGDLPTSITSLDVSNNPISDFGFLRDLSKLSWTLNIDNTKFHNWRQVSERLHHLQYFYAAFTDVEEIVVNGREDWQKLTILDLGGTKIESLAPLKNVTARELDDFMGPEFEVNSKRNCPTSGVPEAVAKFCGW